MNRPGLLPSESESREMTGRIAQWIDADDASELFLLAGLRRKIGPAGDLQAAYREWYENHMREHDRMLIHLAGELARRGGGHGG
jgi:hypothetical protein